MQHPASPHPSPQVETCAPLPFDVRELVVSLAGDVLLAVGEQEVAVVTLPRFHQVDPNPNQEQR